MSKPTDELLSAWKESLNRLAIKIAQKRREANAANMIADALEEEHLRLETMMETAIRQFTPPTP